MVIPDAGSFATPDGAPEILLDDWYDKIDKHAVTKRLTPVSSVFFMLIIDFRFLLQLDDAKFANKIMSFAKILMILAQLFHF